MPALALRTRLGFPAARLSERRRQAGVGFFLALAIAAHLVAVGAFVALPRLADAFHLGGTPMHVPPPATIEMIQENTPTVGASKAARAARTAQARSPTRQRGAPAPLSAPRSSESVAAADTGDAATAASPTTAAPATPETAQDSAPAPEVNLDLDDDDAPGTGLVDGPNVIPASPDAKHPNLPPSYPREAALRGEQGTVGLIVSVGPDGHPAGITIASSSGYAALDDAARRAVERWHFRPGQQNGQPTSSVFNQQITFELGTRP